MTIEDYGQQQGTLKNNKSCHTAERQMAGLKGIREEEQHMGCGSARGSPTNRDKRAASIVAHCAWQSLESCLHRRWRTFTWSGTFSTGSLTQIRPRRRRWVLSTRVLQITADERVVMRSCMARHRCVRWYPCDYAVLVSKVHLWSILVLGQHMWNFMWSVSGVKGRFLATSQGWLFRSRMYCTRDARPQCIFVCWKRWAK